MDEMEERNGIPKFDLAEQIMAEQRKNSSVKRKGPADKVDPGQRHPRSHPAGQAMQPHIDAVGQEQVIADIVARDIERLCRNTA
jgi:hypothetical protein